MTIKGDGIITGSTAPCFRAAVTSAQSISLNSFTKVQFNSEVFDPANCYDPATYRFTPNVPGYYFVSANMYNNTTAQLYIYKNGAAEITGPYVTSTGHAVNGMVYMNGTTDYLEVFYYGLAITTANNLSTSNQFSACLVRST